MALDSELWLVVDKNCLPDLAELAKTNFRSKAAGTTDIDTVFEIIQHLRSEFGFDNDLISVAEDLRVEHVLSMLKHTAYRAHLTNNTDELGAQMDELAFAADLVKVTAKYCNKHPQVFKQPADKLSYCYICLRNGSVNRDSSCSTGLNTSKIWVLRAQNKDTNGSSSESPNKARLQSPFSMPSNSANPFSGFGSSRTTTASRASVLPWGG